MITITSSLRTVPSPSSVASTSCDHLVGGLHLPDEPRGHAPEEPEPPLDLGKRGERHDRHFGPILGDEPGAEARLGEGHDGLGVEQPGRLAGRLRHRLREAVGLRPRRQPAPAGTARSARSAMRAITSTVSTGKRPVAVSAESMIASAPVEDGGGHVAHLGARGPRVRDHGLEHLGGHDHRHLGQPRLPDHVLLDDPAPPRAAPRPRDRPAPPSPRPPAAGCPAGWPRSPRARAWR